MLGREELDKMYRAMQIDLLRNYRMQNMEINTLYFQFHMKAKILFAAQAVSLSSFGDLQ